MDAKAHVGELAELYAFGALDESEREAVETHIAHCPACLRRLGEAEEALLALDRGKSAVAPPRDRANVTALPRRTNFSWWVVAAIAAAFVAGLLFPRLPFQGDPATLAMVQSHFSHAQFAGAGPAAKVLYARDRSWYYVIVAGNHRFDVYGVRGTQATLLGTTLPRRLTSELFVRSRARFTRVELRNKGALVERASIL